MLEQKNSRKQGDVGLGAAISAFTCSGWTVCVPLTDNQPYDLVIDRGDGPERVQVKTTRCKTKYGIYQVSLRTKGGNRSGAGKVKFFSPEEVEWLFVLNNDGEQYLIPAAKISSKAAINLSGEFLKYKMGV